MDIASHGHCIDDNKKLQFIRALPLVEEGFEFPSTKIKDSKTKSGFSERKCSMKTLLKYPFLAYSKSQDGVFCLPCKLWTTTPVHGTEAAYLISQPFSNWKKINEKMSSHMKTLYHLDSVMKMDNFKKVQDGIQPSALASQSRAHDDLVKKNTKVIGEMFRCMKLCVERGFARRGHRDAGMETIDEEDEGGEVINLGNFKEIVKFSVASGNRILEEHLRTGAKNALYISNIAQDDMLTTIRTLIQQEVINEARNQDGRFIYAISADEATDNATQEQLGVVLRTVDKDGKVHERLLEFVKMESCTGEAISKAIIKCLEEHGLSIHDCRGQTYDGAGAMKGIVNGCQAHISNINPLAEYHHCQSHRLNLALNGTSKITEFAILMENLKQLGIFFKYSPKRQHILRQLLPEDVRVRKVKLLCETRWVERHTTFTELRTLHPYVIKALGSMKGTGFDAKTSSEASGLATYLQSPQFIASFIISDHMLGFTKTLSQMLQGSTKDMVSAYGNIEDVKRVITAQRELDVWEGLWLQMTTINDGEEILKPRTVGRQINRSNHAVDGSKEFYRVSLFLPYIDHLIEQLNEKFQSKDTIVQGFLLIPSHSQHLSYSEYSSKLAPFISRHSTHLPSPSTILQENHMWFLKWQAAKEEASLCDNLHKAYQAVISGQLYPNIAFLLKLLLTLPVTSATVERANSTLKFIKTPMRSTMSQESLNAQVLGYRHKDILKKLKLEDLVTAFSLAKKRRLVLQNPLSE